MVNIPSSFNQGTSFDLTSPGFLNQAAGYLGGAAAPGIAQQGLTAAQALAQAGQADTGLNLGITNATSKTGYDLAGALLNEQGMQLSEQGLASQIGTAAEQQAIEQGQFGLQKQQQGLTEQGTALQKANLEYQFPEQMRAQQGAAAAAGAGQTEGNKQAQGDIRQQHAYQGAQLGLTSQSEYIQGQLQNLGQQAEQVGYAGQQSGMANQYQQLQLAAKQANIPVQQAISQLGYGVGQLGIQADPTALYGQAANAQAGEAGGYGAVLSQAGATTGLGPNFGVGP